MYIHELMTSADKLIDAAYSPDSSDGRIEDALSHTCNTFKKLKKSHSFLRDINRLEHLHEIENDKFEEIIGTYERYQEFFIFEQQLLLSEGLPEDIVLSLATESENILLGMKQQNINKDEIINSIDLLTEYICQSRTALRVKYEARNILEIGAQVSTGLIILGVNVKALPGDLVLPGGHIIASATAGLFIAKDSINENRIFSRLRKYFRRR